MMRLGRDWLRLFLSQVPPFLPDSNVKHTLTVVQSALPS